MSDISKVTLGQPGVVEEDLGAYSANYQAHRKGISFEESIRKYNEWARSGAYEKDLCPGRYNGPEIGANYATKYFDENERGNVVLLDVAAGTGLVGAMLRQRGFTTIDALDPAQGMLDVAAEKGVYREFVCDLIGPTDSKLSQDAYDAVVIAGGMGEGHIPCTGLLELIRVVKPGGVVVIVMREEYLSYVEEYVDRLEPTMALLENAALWRAEERTVVPNYSFGKNGVVYVFRVLVNGTDKDQLKTIENIKDM